MNQQNNLTSEKFSHRTNSLAAAMGCRIGELAVKIGITPRMFYGYRSGKYPVSAKAWRKLAEAEAAAYDRPAEDGANVGEILMPYNEIRSEKEPPRTANDDRYERLERKVETLGKVVSQLVELLTKKES